MNNLVFLILLYVVVHFACYFGHKHAFHDIQKKKDAKDKEG